MAFLSSFWTLDVILVFSSALVAAYFYMTRNFGHWKSRGVMEIPPIPFVGNFGSCLMFRLSGFEYLRFLYEKGKGLPYIGFYICDKPALVLRDPEIIKSVLVRDFNCFWNRYIGTSESDVLGYNNLFLIENPAWKKLRNKLTWVFSSAKMRAMYPLVDAVGEELSAYLDGLDLGGNLYIGKLYFGGISLEVIDANTRGDIGPIIILILDEGQTIDIRSLCAGYTIDTIASCAFGLQVGGVKDPNSAFRVAAKKSFDCSYKRGVEFLSHVFLPGLAKFLGFTFYEANSSKFQRKVFLDTLNERYRSGLKRNDLIDLLVELKYESKKTEESDEIELTDDILIAQAAVFFAAGFETSATVLSFTLHELSLNLDIQTQLRNEIMTALQENDGKLPYDVLQKLPYMDQVICEGLRKYPSLSFLDRVAQTDYTVPTTGLVIKKGTPVYITTLGLHYDPEYYPNPEHFDPERFNEKNKKQRPPFVYLPFGDGPRNCIGLRFGLMQVKTGLSKILTNYELTPCKQTCDPIRFDARGFVLRSKSVLYHCIRKIKETDG